MLRFNKCRSATRELHGALNSTFRGWITNVDIVISYWKIQYVVWVSFYVNYWSLSGHWWSQTGLCKDLIQQLRFDVTKFIHLATRMNSLWFMADKFSIRLDWFSVGVIEFVIFNRYFAKDWSFIWTLASNGSSQLELAAWNVDICYLSVKQWKEPKECWSFDENFPSYWRLIWEELNTLEWRCH